MNDTEILKWVAIYVMDIASFPSPRKRETIQITASDNGTNVTVMRTGRDHLDALKRCVRAAAKKLPAQRKGRAAR